jgi:hypothetical protein
MMTQLIETSLNSRTLVETDVARYSNTSLAFSTFHFKGKNTNPIEDFMKSDTKYISTFGKTRQEMKKYYPFTKLSENESYYNYYLVYDKYHADFTGRGIKIQDELKGIYHFSIGQNFGLLRQANFKRVDQPGLREAKSLGKNTIFLGQFRDRYNVDLTLVGNNIFIPGMIVYITPSIEIGNPADPESFSEISGIGGYYTVISVNSRIAQGEYTTILDCTFHASDGEQKAKNVCKLTELQAAGIVNSDFTAGSNYRLLDQFIQDLSKAKNQAGLDPIVLTEEQAEQLERQRLDSPTPIGQLGRPTRGPLQ